MCIGCDRVRMYLAVLPRVHLLCMAGNLSRRLWKDANATDQGAVSNVPEALEGEIIPEVLSIHSTVLNSISGLISP